VNSSATPTPAPPQVEEEGEEAEEEDEAAQAATRTASALSSFLALWLCRRWLERIVVARVLPKKPRLLALLRLRWSVRLLGHGSLQRNPAPIDRTRCYIVLWRTVCVSWRNARHARNMITGKHEG
jgi:hypothetical protein